MSIFVLIAHDQHIGGTQGQVPGVVPGNEVAHVPDETSKLYLEARKCVSVWTSQGFADTSLRIFRHGFKCLRADPAEMAVSPDVIIEGLDVLVDIRYSHRSSSVDAFLDPLFL